MKVPQHTIIKSELSCKASEELQEEVEQELQKAKASEESHPDITELLSKNENTKEL